MLTDILSYTKFEKHLLRISEERAIARYYLHKNGKEVLLLNSLDFKFNITQKRIEYLDTIIKLKEIVEFIGIDNSMRINTMVIPHFKNEIVNIHKMFISDFVYTAKFDPGVSIPDDFEVPLCREVFTGYSLIKIIGLISFTHKHDQRKCECCGRIRYYSTDFRFVYKENIINTDQEELRNESDKIDNMILAKIKGNLIYDSSVDLPDIKASSVDSNLFRIEF